MTPAAPEARKKRIAIFSRYSLADQYNLAAEFRGMLAELASRCDVLHLSLRGQQPPASAPAGVEVAEISPAIDRRSPRDVVLKSILMYPALALALPRLRRFKPDAIFISEILPVCGLIFKAFCRANVATAYGDWHVHNFLGKKSWSKPFIKISEAMERAEARKLDGFFCRASAAREKLMSMGVAPEHIRVVYDAPDTGAFFPQNQAELRKQCGFGPDDVVLLYHGVMHQGKGLDKLLEWTAALHQEDPRIGIILVGSGPELKPLQALAERLGLGRRAFFTGWLKTIKEVGEYINASDICVAMRTGAESNVHIVPGALLHSMACRKVVIGPLLPGIAEIIRHGENGFMFAADNGDDFRKLIRHLLTLRERWPEIARRAYDDIINNYSVPAAARQYANALEHFARL